MRAGDFMGRTFKNKIVQQSENMRYKNPHITNRKRASDFFNLKHKIESATCQRHLESMREILTKFVRTNKGDDANDLMILFLQKENELNPLNPLNPYYEDEILNIQHKKLSV